MIRKMAAMVLVGLIVVCSAVIGCAEVTREKYSMQNEDGEEVYGWYTYDPETDGWSIDEGKLYYANGDLYLETEEIDDGLVTSTTKIYDKNGNLKLIGLGVKDAGYVEFDLHGNPVFASRYGNPLLTSAASEADDGKDDVYFWHDGKWYTVEGEQDIEVDEPDFVSKVKDILQDLPQSLLPENAGENGTV